MAEIYRYQEHGRRPATLLALIIFAMLGALSLWKGAGWYVWAIWLPSVGMLIWLITVNPASGLMLTDTHLTVHWHRTRHEIPLSDIAKVQLIRWSDSDDLRIHRHAGPDIKVFSSATPPPDKLLPHLHTLGLTVCEE